VSEIEDGRGIECPQCGMKWFGFVNRREVCACGMYVKWHVKASSNKSMPVAEWIAPDNQEIGKTASKILEGQGYKWDETKKMWLSPYLKK